MGCKIQHIHTYMYIHNTQKRYTSTYIKLIRVYICVRKLIQVHVMKPNGRYIPLDVDIEKTHCGNIRAKYGKISKVLAKFIPIQKFK